MDKFILERLPFSLTGKSISENYQMDIDIGGCENMVLSINSIELRIPWYKINLDRDFGSFRKYTTTQWSTVPKRAEPQHIVNEHNSKRARLSMKLFVKTIWGNLLN